MQDNPPPGSYEVSKAFLCTQGTKTLASFVMPLVGHMQLGLSTLLYLHIVAGKMDSSAINTGFLSTLDRFAPPRDISLEEPDVCNPGEYVCNACMYVCVLYIHDAKVWVTRLYN